jgi:hypothetical protein
MRKISSRIFLGVILIAILLLAPFWTVAQEEAARSNHASDGILPPSFDVVTPLDEDVVSGSLIFIILPREGKPDWRATVKLVETQEEISLFFPSWSGEWNTSSVQNGSYSLEFTLCNSSSCSTQTRSIRVENTTAVSLPREPDISLPQTRSNPSSSSSETRPFPDVPFISPTETYTVYGPNIFSLGTAVLSSDSSQKYRSSGDPFILEKGAYDFSFSFFSSFFSEIVFSRTQIDSDGQLVRLTSVPVSSFAYRGDYYDVTESVLVEQGFVSRQVKATLGGPSSQSSSFYCTRYDRFFQSCLVTWLPIPVENGSLTLSTDARSFVVVRTRRAEGFPPNHPTHTIIPSNLQHGEFSAHSSSNATWTLTSATHTLPEGLFRLELNFFEGPFFGVSLNDVLVDHSSTLLTLTPIFPSPFSSEETWEGFFDYDFESARASIARGYDSSFTLFCGQWDSVQKQCLSSWEPFSPSLLSRGSFALRISPRLPVTVVDQNITSPSRDDALLRQTIQRLHTIHTGKRFFLSPNALSAFEVLSTLFSDIEVDLECPPNGNVRGSRDKNNNNAVPPAPSTTDLLPTSTDSSRVPLSPSPAQRSLFSIPLAYADENSPLFLSNEWENFLPYPADWRQRENSLSCAGVALQNTFSFAGVPADTPKEVFLGGSRYRVKQSFLLTNDSNVSQTRLLNIRLTTPFSQLATESTSFSPDEWYARVPAHAETIEVKSPVDENVTLFSQTIIRDAILRFSNDEGQLIGTYDFSDLFDVNGVTPQTVIHQKQNDTIIETIMQVDVPAHSTLLLDPSYDLNTLQNFHARWYGARSSDFTGTSSANSLLLPDMSELDVTYPRGTQVVNVDNGSYANDLLVSSVYADINGKADAGAVYLIQNIDDTLGSLDLNLSTSYKARFSGSAAGDFFGSAIFSGPAVQLVDIDGNGYTNDLVVTAIFTDFVSGDDSGSVYLIKDIDNRTGNFDMNNTNHFSVRWDGNSIDSSIGYTYDSGQGVKVVNVDNNTIANDLLIASPLTSSKGRTFNGTVYLVKDVNTLSGIFPFSSTSSFSVAWEGSQANDILGSTFTRLSSGDRIILLNTDGNVYANDLLIGAEDADTNATNTGALYLIKDIDKKFGLFDLNTATSFDVRWDGGAANDQLGHTLNSGSGIQAVDIDGNGVANDLFITAIQGDILATNTGVVYLIKDINTLSGIKYLGDPANFTTRWYGSANNNIGAVEGSGQGVQIVNIDNNALANDLLIAGFALDIGATNNGGVYLIRDVNTFSGDKPLSSSANYSIRINGSISGDQLGSSSFSGQGVQLVNVDNNVGANDLLITANKADMPSLDSGAVYLLKDINVLSGNFDFNDSSKYNVRWASGGASDFLGRTYASGLGVQLVNADDNAYLNDLLLSAPSADVNAKTDAGAVWLIRDIDKLSGDMNLLNSLNYSLLWTGGRASDGLGANYSGFSATQLVNSDNNSYSNDLLIADSNADGPQTDAGMVVLIRDIDKISNGSYDLNGSNSFFKKFWGGYSSDFLSQNYNSYQSVFSTNVDSNGGYSNDLLFVASRADVNGFTDNGAVYLIRNSVLANTPNYSFVLSLPSSGCTTGKGNISGGSACQKGWIETTDTTGAADQNKVDPEGQSSTVPFLSYDNQSSSLSDLNIYLDLNASLPSTLQMKVSQQYGGWSGTCTGNPILDCLLLSTTAANAGRAYYSAGSQDLNLFIWGDFVSTGTGRVDINVDSNALSSII